MNQMDRKRRCRVIGISLGIVLVFPLAVQLFDRRQPIELIDGKMVPDVVKPGDRVGFVWHARELAPSEGTFTRIITDSSGVPHVYNPEPTVYRLRRSDVVQTFSKEFTLPLGLAEGWATYSTRGYRWRNNLQKWFWKIPFESPPTRFYVVRERVEDLPLEKVPDASFDGTRRLRR